MASMNLLLLAGLSVASAHTVFMCIDASSQNEIIAYAGSYHTNSKVGGMVIAGGESGNEQYGARCPKPYNYQSGRYAGEVPCSITRNGAQPWLCGDRFNWETGPALSFAQVVAAAPTANCDQVGTAATVSGYTTTQSSITWNRVTIPVDACGPGIYYDLVSTSDSCDDTPWMNEWATVECVEGDFTDVITDDPECSITGVTCPAPQTVSANAQCQATVDTTGATVASSDCSSVDVSQASTTFPLGTSTTVVTAQEGAESATCTATVTVVDDSAPTVSIVPALTLEACPADVSVAATGTAVAADNCGATVSFADVETVGACAANKDIVRTFTATDAAGNTATSTQTITVRDTTAPALNKLADRKLLCTDDTSVAANGTPSATDACVSPSVTFADLLDNAPNSCDADYTIFRTWTAADECGNESSFVQTLTVADSVAPVINALSVPDMTVSCDAPNDPSSLGKATAVDDCSGFEINHSDLRIDGSCPNDYTIKRTWTATDECGNKSSHVQTITVQDTTAPVQNPVVEQVCLWPPNHKYACFAGATANDATAFVSGFDNCGEVSVAFSGCVSSQPDEVNQGGDGNTNADCYYNSATDEVCFRAERQGRDKAGRVYGALFTASDECGNSATFDRNIYVPHSGKGFNLKECIEADRE